MKLHLGGHLNFFDTGKRSRLEIAVPSEGLPLVDILQNLNVPVGEVAIVAVNGELADLEACRVYPQDSVEVYPPIGGG
ncbi:MAG TPA: MoaD/ThiS family protein [Anaerolineaceae bacterium]